LAPPTNKNVHLSDLKKFSILAKIHKLASVRKLSVYLVGGALRDCILGRPSELLDFDFAVEKDSLLLAKELSRVIRAPFVLLNEPHGSARVIVKFNANLINLDFSDFRAKTIEGDLEKRDFTINALAINLADVLGAKKTQSDSRIIDPFGARQDLRKRLIRMISPANFKDDPLRMLRAFSLSARLAFKIEKSTLARIKSYSRLINISASERVREELFKIFSASNSYEYLKVLWQAGLLERIIPEVKSMYRLRQGSYHNLDVWKHSLETFEKLEDIINKPLLPNRNEIKEYLSVQISGSHRRSDLIKLAALLHDVGKPPTFSVTSGKVHFYGHERVGAKIAENIFSRLKLSSKEIKLLKLLIYWHLRPGYMSDIRNLSKRAVFRFLRDCQDEAVSVLLLSLADQRATRGKLKRAPERLRQEKLVRGLIREFFRIAKEEKPNRFLTGNDIMNELKIQPGPIVGKILNEINEAQAEGLISTKPQALKRAKNFYKQLGANEKKV